MATSVLGKRKRSNKHPYLSGNFAPIHETCTLTPCSYSGTIPDELAGGEYVRNGSNPVSNEDLGRDAHWFDGDGMLFGVSFTRIDSGPSKIQPQFVNQYLLTDVFLSAFATSSLKRPILPSISTLANPVVSLGIRKISVANTSIVYHDGRAMATCESGPPLRISLPSLDTIGWFNGRTAEGESADVDGPTLGGSGMLSFMKEWTTAHPKVDPDTGEMILFQSNFLPPYVHYSIIPATHKQDFDWSPPSRILNLPIPGISSAKMMHDFGVSKCHTIIMDLPLSLDPLKLIKNKPVISYDPDGSSRFGIFPRLETFKVRWFETSACCIFHVANTWDVPNNHGSITAINMLACRLTSASLIFSTGNITGPSSMKGSREAAKPVPFFEKYSDDPMYERDGVLIEAASESSRPDLEQGCTSGDFEPVMQPSNAQNFVEDDQCRLYFYSFSLQDDLGSNTISHQFALSAIPFEFPSVSPKVQMSAAQYIYGCTTTLGTFGSALGIAVKIDALVKFDAKALIARGVANPPPSVTGCVDNRSVQQILDSSSTKADTIQIFRPPPGIFAQEPRFVPSFSGASEDSGFLLSYMFDESQLLSSGDAPLASVSELWVIDAQSMKDVLARIHLPQRVPYGLHGNWFPEDQVLGQRSIERIRNIRDIEKTQNRISTICRRTIDGLITTIGG